MAARRRRRKRKNIKKLVFCTLVEFVVAIALIFIIGWNRGLETWFQELSKPTVKSLDISGINSSHAVLITARGGKVIGEINSQEQIYPASLTKMMTAIVAIEEIKDLSTEITLTDEIFYALTGKDATQAGFQPGETVTAENLIYGALLPSGAECCLALAEKAAGSEEAFVELMNKKASRIGMKSTHFSNTVGLHSEENYSTAMDMAILLKYCIRNDAFREMIGSSWRFTGPTNVHPDGITYHSTLFKNLSTREVTGGEILGGKTGYTDAAGMCLASFAQICGTEYILVTVGAPGGTGLPLHVNDALTIYNRLGEAVLALEN